MDGEWMLMAEFPTSQIPKDFFNTPVGCRKPWDVYIYPKGFSHHQLMGVFFFETVHNGADFSYSNPSTWCWSDFSFHLE